MAKSLWDWRRYSQRAVTVLAMLVLASMPLAGADRARAQPAAPAASADDQGSAPADDLMSLVAPIALYPDPVLALVLQAATQPLQVVQAERFLEKRKKDPKLAPDAAWDRSILGLLNYPSLVEQMNAYLDWTEALGDAVVDRLDDVQGAIQDIRWGAYNTGILVDSKQQKVVAEGNIVRILPADPKTVSIPKYDPVALLAAIEPPEVVEEEVPIPTPAAASAPAAPAAQEPQPAPAAPPNAAPAAPAEAAYAPGPAYAPAPYTGPPMVSYAEPQTGFWESAATFTGGAIIGGLLGYALADDDDDDNDDWFDDDDYGGGRNINIEDSTVVVGGGRYDQTRVQNELRTRRGDVERAPSRERVSQIERGGWQAAGVAPTRPASQAGARPGRAEAKPAVRLPNAGAQPAVSQQRQQRDRAGQAARQPRAAPAAGFGKREPGEGGVAALQPRSQTRKAAERGARSQAGRGEGGGRARVVPASTGGGDGGMRRAGGDGGGGLGGIGRGERAARDADRGRQSRGDGGGGGRGAPGRR